MMLKVLEDESFIKKYRRQFVRSFKPFVDHKIQVHLGHPGGAFRAKVFWSSRLGIWMHHEKISGNRCGHAFGVGKPTEKSTVPITCEISFPLHGIDRRMGGALAKDRQGRIFIVHRGKIGGGKKGVGKALFEKYYRGTWAVMEDGLAETPVALVGMLHSPRFVRQVTQFVRKVNQMKDETAHRSPQVEIAFDEPRFREELSGAGYDRLEWNPDLNCDHGLIVSDLYEVLKEKGFKVGNDITRDLFIVSPKRQITTVFQVMTEPSTAVVHAGISKLLLSGIDLPEKPRLVLTIPRGMDQTLSAKLKKLGIDILEYEWQQDKTVFPDLHDIINIR
jgi:hypothetical protein